MGIIDMMDYEKGKRFENFKQYTYDYITKTFNEKGYTELDTNELTLYFKYAIGGEYFLPQGVSFAIRQIANKQDYIQTENIYKLNWKEVYKNKTELHKALKRLVNYFERLIKEEIE